MTVKLFYIRGGLHINVYVFRVGVLVLLNWEWTPFFLNLLKNIFKLSGSDILHGWGEREEGRSEIQKMSIETFLILGLVRN